MRRSLPARSDACSTKLARLAFGPFRLDAREQCMWRAAQRIQLAPKPFGLLWHLASASGALTTKDELLHAVWPDSNVCDAVLKTCVADLRRLLGDDAAVPLFIETVRGRGYRFVSPVATSNLPARQTHLVGRDRDRAGIRRLLAASRVVTLVGPPGAGKTAVATHVAAEILPHSTHGAAWVDLAPVGDLALLGAHVAAALGARLDAPASAGDALADAIGHRRLLLVLDGCEHLVDGCAALVEPLLRRCPNLRVLATGREPLGIEAEARWRVTGLSVPAPSAPPSKVRANLAVRLFVARAREAAGSFVLSRDHIGAVATICRRVDGLPLAIALAAARVAVLTPEQIAARLDDALGCLGTAAKTGSPHHRSFAAALDWSYDALPANERLLLANLSVFDGAFTIGDVETVCREHGLESTDALDLLASLVNRSLVEVRLRRRPAAGENCYELLNLVRQYARKRLAEPGVGQRDRRFAALIRPAGPAGPQAAATAPTGPRMCTRP